MFNKSRYTVYAHTRSNEVWFIDFVGDAAAAKEMQERKKLFQKEFPLLVVQTHVVTFPSEEEFD